MGCSMPGSSVLHYLSEFAPVHIHWVSDAIQPSHPLLPPFLFTLNLSQHQGLFQWVSSSHQVAKVLELQPQHQSFQWIFRVDFLRISIRISLWLSVTSCYGPVLSSHRVHSEHPLTSSKLSYIFNIFPIFSLPTYFPLTLGALKDLISHLQAGASLFIFLMVSWCFNNGPWEKMK